MNEQHAFDGTAKADSRPALKVTSSEPAPAPAAEYRSGVFAKARRDGSGGWGFVLIDLVEAPRTVTLADGMVVGATSRDARIEGEGIASEHLRVSVRSDGCYLEDLGSATGTFVGGVRAKRIGVMHGDVVRLGRQLAIFVERDLALYSGAVSHTGDLVHGPKQRRDWIDPALELAKKGSCLCLEGGPGLGKRTLARLAGAVRETAGEVVVLDSRADGKPAIPAGARPATWVVLEADRLPRPQQLEVAHAVGRATGVSILATANQPLDRAVGDGLVAPWFASLFSGRRIVVPALEARREDIPLLIHHLAQKRNIPLARFTPEFVEAMVRSGWPGGIPQLEAAITTAAEGGDGALTVAPIASMLSRPSPTKASLPPSTDPSLARARLEDALARANGSVASAARSLGMSRQAIYREADRLGLDIARRKTPRS